jgi:hypothetical protein
MHPGEGGTNQQPVALSPDYPTPAAATDRRPFFWNADEVAVLLHPRFGRRLAMTDDLYRLPGYGAGLLLGSPCSDIPPIEITKGNQFAPVITDRIPVIVIKNGKPNGSRIPAADLNTMLGTELFLQQFRPLDRVVTRPMYLGEFALTTPGYNDGGRGQRVLYIGRQAQVENSQDAINAFLDVMPFADNADRSNAVALALTVMLRNYWPGGKPVWVITSDESHGGKDTIVAFAAGGTPKVSVDYESADWAFRQGFVAALKSCPEAGVVNVENARLGRGDQFIASALLERFLTDPAPVVHSTKFREALTIENHPVVTITTNFGSVSEDLQNRGLSIHLQPVGNVADRETPIGNPKLEYLPANRDRIEAELRGMVERWKREGQPLDKSVRHPFGPWAQAIGGILQVNGFSDFLGNYLERRTSDDPLRKALGQLGVYEPNEWLTASLWAIRAGHLGLTAALIARADRESGESRSRAMGVVLTAHREETFLVETDDEMLTLRLEKGRRRFGGANPSTRYRFVVLGQQPVPEDEET